MILAWLLTLISGTTAFAADKVDPYWEYGIGFGYAQYMHYPASNQTSNVFLPFPTFQYRGEILRADDREGAHAYLLREPNWTLEISGTGFAPLDASKNEARSGMDNLPLIIAMGPQIQTRWLNDFQFGFGVFGAIGTNFKSTGLKGEIYEAQAVYRWRSELGKGFLEIFDESHGRLALNIKAASRSLHELYYSVPADQATATRPQYDAKAGYLNHEITYFQSFKAGKAAVYVGASFADFSSSANQQSPLYKVKNNLSYVVGMTYVLGQSAKPEVREEETSGLLNRFRQNEPF